MRDEYGEQIYEQAESIADLDSECRGVIEEVAALTGSEPCADCPMALTRSENNAWVHVVTRLYRASERGGVRDRLPNPSAVMFDALEILADAVDARKAHDAEETAKRIAARASAGAPPPSSDEES